MMYINIHMIEIQYTCGYKCNFLIYHFITEWCMYAAV